jgi:hypothetical protein
MIEVGIQILFNQNKNKSVIIDVNLRFVLSWSEDSLVGATWESRMGAGGLPCWLTAMGHHGRSLTAGFPLYMVIISPTWGGQFDYPLNFFIF